ncbi:MAG: nucleotide exchange factor GrpE [Clostridia bacterium]|nr:nucleotide exchange factor GrpE [Clostridia bacterium]
MNDLENKTAPDTEAGANTDTSVEKEVETEIEEEPEKETRSEKKKVKKLEAELEKQSKLLESKESELSVLNDKYMRMMAEYDNYRRRSAKEREDVYSDAYGEAISAMLPVIDNLERAANFSESDKVQEGIALTFKSFSETLTKLGIESFGQVGEPFDPTIHNAVMHVEDESLGESVITDVFQKGYRKGDKIIRHAMVKVAN